MVSMSAHVYFVKKRSTLMLRLSGGAQVMTVAEKFQYVVRETLKCLD